MQITESLHYGRSDYTADFRLGLVTNASQYANLQVVQGLSRGDVKGYIVSAKIQSIQKLDWRLEIHSRRLSEASAPFYSGTRMARMNNLVATIQFSKEQATGYATSFMYFRDALKIPYIDEDSLGEVHVNLLNQNATAKLPGDTGAIHVAFGFVAAS